MIATYATAVPDLGSNLCPGAAEMLLILFRRSGNSEKSLFFDHCSTFGKIDGKSSEQEKLLVDLRALAWASRDGVR